MLVQPSPFPLHLLWFSANWWPWGCIQPGRKSIFFHYTSFFNLSFRAKETSEAEAAVEAKGLQCVQGTAGVFAECPHLALWWGEWQGASAATTLSFSLCLPNSRLEIMSLSSTSLLHLLEYPNMCPVNCLTCDNHVINSCPFEHEWYIPILVVSIFCCDAFLTFRLRLFWFFHSWKDNSSFVPWKLVPSGNWQKPRRSPHSQAQSGIYKRQSVWTLHIAPSVSMKYFSGVTHSCQQNKLGRTLS